ncbi:MAG: HRDC domain-containing protein [Pirellulales bacterium]|nr:HRDC domain-containing protein [Pirellulales bacterium]
MPTRSYLITTQAALDELCDRLAVVDRIGFDTEFVSEDTYYPQLCLIQVATATEIAAVDPFAVDDVTPLWQVLATKNHTSIVHAGREEFRFCFRSVRRPPSNLFDTQIAAGMIGPDYPAAYGTLVSRFLKHRLEQSETRTDWRKRPLSEAQIRYALDDVQHLLPLHIALQRRLMELDRNRWLAEELEVWKNDIQAAENRPNWRRVSGIGGLSPRSLAIIRELWFWRQEEAARRDQPPRRIFRDDLLVEVAKRKSADPEKIKAIRGLYRGARRRMIESISACVQRGLAAPLENFNQYRLQDLPPQLNLLGQFLTPALASLCRKENIAVSLVGTASDVRDLVAYRLGYHTAKSSKQPILATGWRSEFIGHLIEDLLAGRKSIRIDDPASNHPLSIE